jgi:MEMO1 family protein
VNGKELVMDNKGTQTVRKAWYAGTWYAADPTSLRATINQAIHAARTVEDKRMNSLGVSRFAVLPHAGLAYSARGIAHLLVHAPPDITKVVVVAPSHYVHLDDDLFTVAPYDAYDTPIGQLPGFSVFAKDYPRQVENQVAIQREHAVEMVLPFIAYLQEQRKKKISVSTVLVSNVETAQSARLLAEDLREALGQEELESGSTMVIASSDFTHYGERFGFAPFGVGAQSEISRRVRENDLELANYLASMEIGPIFLHQRKQRSTVCGIAAALVVSSLAAMLSTKGLVADYYTSQDVVGDNSSDFVAYCTILWR